MPAKTKSKSTPAKVTAKSKPAVVPAKKAPAGRPTPKSAAGAMTLPAAMSALEKAGSAQTCKTYARHGAEGPMFGVSFATLKVLMKRIGVDHALAMGLWDTGNFDARNLALKVVDPARLSAADLDRWVSGAHGRMSCGTVAHLAAETAHAQALIEKWLGKKGGAQRPAGWSLLGAIAFRDATLPDAWFAGRLAEIERTIHTAPNGEREAMNSAVIAIGCRNAALRKAAVAAAGRIGKVDVDHGDTACKTPDAATYIAKTWAHSTSKGFDSPAAHERSREPARLRC